ncbi:MAG: FliM/FliN family flagellar motor switch protein [Peptococcaceae bacterium]|nr:FliM/FliN family flagellar motor switch protein [Peptococcaceae bacterium]
MLTQEQINELIGSFEKQPQALVRKVRFPELTPGQGSRIKTGINYLGNVKVTLMAVLGETSLRIRDILALEEGSVVPLDCSSGDAVQLWVNNQKFAKGEVLVINDNFVIRLHSVDAPRKMNPEAGGS